MKKYLVLLLICALLTGCTGQPGETTMPEATQLTGDIVEISLDGQEITLGDNASGVYTSRDIVYYEQKTAYESGNPYGEGEEWEMHTAEEAAAHLVVNITQPGNYRLSGKLDKGQIRIDLGEDACEDPDAVVNLILDGVEITCTVAPAILFQNVYECDGNWSVDTATPDVNTLNAGANLILAENSENSVTGSHVAKIFKDKDGEKKLWKQDGAIYSYMSMNVWGPGTLNLTADNEGLDTELHLTIHGGDINIRSGNDGINTNEDGVSVTTINGGNLHIVAGLGAEGDGIDSNGYLVIRGGTVVSWANPAADAGLDSDLGSFIHGGTVLAFGSAMDWAESESGQVTMNLQFEAQQQPGSAVVISREDGSVVFAYDPAADSRLGDSARSYRGVILSCPGFQVGDAYEVYVGSTVTGTDASGIVQEKTAAGFSGGTRMAYTGTDVMMGPGGFRPGQNGQRPEGDPGQHQPQGDREPPEGMEEPPEGWTRPEGNWSGPEGEWTDREGDWTIPEGEMPPGHREDPDGFREGVPGEAQTRFLMQDKVNFFSGLIPAE